MPTPVTRLLAAMLALVAALAGCSDGRPPRRVLIVGWDGATFDVIDPMLERGELPHLAALIERGVRSNLQSTRIPISSAAWPTMVTGKGPGDHGVYSFFRPKEGSYDVELISARDVASPPIWRILSGRGHIVNVWGVPVTYPPEPVRGTLVAGMLSPFDADYAHPPGFADRLRETGFVPDLGIWRQDEIADMDEIERQLAIKEREVLELLERKDWSFSMVAFKSLDVLCHRPTVGLGSPDVARLLVRLDEILGAMVEAAGKDTAVLVVSDHGFAEYRRTFDLHRWLVESGWSVQDESALPANVAAGPLAEARANERSFRIGTLDMSKTRAYADVAEGNFGAIRLNVAGREPDGIVERADVEETLAALERDLRTVEFPAGVPVVTVTYRGTSLYPGPRCDATVPDLIVELDPQWRGTTSVFGEPLAVGTPPFPDHAFEGIFVGAGGGISNHFHLSGVEHLIEVAPLVLHLLDEPIPRSFPGDPNFHQLTGRDPRERVDDADDPGMRSSEEVYADRVDDASNGEVASRVREIGYGK